jgi:hypothetical protein
MTPLARFVVVFPPVLRVFLLERAGAGALKGRGGGSSLSSHSQRAPTRALFKQVRRIRPRAVPCAVSSVAGVAVPIAAARLS